jgi:exosortase A-associated hydrolase 2
MAAREEMFFFEGSGGRKLLGFLHPASSPSKGLGLVYCHPFAEEKNQSHVIAVRAARRLAATGVAVLRFDFSGCGDSEGDLADASADDWLEEIGRAADLLKAKTGVARVGFWGLRAGANLAALHAATRSDAALAMLWQPLPDLKTFATQFLRQKLASGIAAGAVTGTVKDLVEKLEAGETVEVMGYPIKHRLYASLANKNAGPAKSAYAFPVGVFAFGEDETPPDWIKRMAEGVKANDAPAALIHVREEPFWDRYWRWDAPETAASAARWIESVA